MVACRRVYLYHVYLNGPVFWSMTLKLRIFLLTLFLLFCVVLWGSETITFQGERTVYTANCKDGARDEERCTGRIAAGDRYRYRALQGHNEVLFWIAGSKETSGKFVPCDIVDGRNWKCDATDDIAQTVTLEMIRGHAMPDPAGQARPFHAVSKWTWMMLESGLSAGESDRSRKLPGFFA